MRAKRQTRPGKRESDRLWQIKDYWLAREATSPFFQYCWYDAGARKVRRKSTGLRDLEEAKVWLAKLVLAEPPDEPLHPDNVAVASIRRFYFQHHVNVKVGGRDKVRDKKGPRRAFALATIYLNRVMREDGLEGAPKAGHFTLARQESFMIWCRDEHKLTGKTISTYLSYLKAAFRFAAKPRIIEDARGRKREVRLLSEVPHIEDGEQAVANITLLPRSKPREWIPDDAELAAIIDGLPEDRDHEAAFRYMIMALNTWARPEAILELSVKAQVDFQRGLVHLNPPGRLQNKKVRPVIRLTDNLRGWLLHWNVDRPLVYFDRPVAKVDARTLKKAAVRAIKAGCLDPSFDVSRINRYMLRHYMSTRVRSIGTVQVSREDRAKWLGHLDPEFSTTEKWYESLDPDYLANPMRATDAIIVRLGQLTRRTLVSPDVHPTSNLVLLKSQAK